METHLLLDIEETIMVCSLVSMATQIARMETGNGRFVHHLVMLQVWCFSIVSLNISLGSPLSIPLMNQIERGRRVEREIEWIGTETVAQGMIESEIETEVKGTRKPIGAMLVGGDEYEQTFFLCFAC
jgi:hypothetical protein